MRRAGLFLLGAAGGVLASSGAAVLIQQYGLWPLDPELAYGAPLAGAVLGAGWTRIRRRRAGLVPAVLAAALVVPVGAAALRQGACQVFVESDSGVTRLADTSPRRPFRIDPEVDETVRVVVQGAGFEGIGGEAWVEVGGIRTFIDRSTVRGAALQGEFDLRDNGFADLGGAPGVYHVGGSIDGVCSVEGYVRIAGNPLTSPVGQAAVGAVFAGLMLTWLAGRPPLPPPDGRVGRLRPDGHPVGLDGVEIRSPGLDGEAELRSGPDPAEGGAGWTAEAREAFTRHHMELDRVIEISDTAMRPGVGSEIVTHDGRPALQLDLPSPRPEHGQVVLATDESGVTTWHLPRLESGAVDVLRTGATCTYRIPRRIGPTGEPIAPRGLVETVGAKVLSSLMFPLLDPLFERVGERLARVWEEKRRPYRFRTFTPAAYRTDDVTEPDWDELASGRALLLVHGTFSRAHTGFGSLPRPTVEQLHDRYEGRVFAFDHFTLSHDPIQNVAWFLDRLPERIALNLDILSHSRGGLVARVLAEKQDELSTGGRQVNVEKIVFAAAPNSGTILADSAYVGDLIDSYTNLLNFVPGPHVVDVLEGVITVVKQAAVGAAGALPGLRAMQPGGEFLTRLNTTASNRSRYYAVAGSYEPHHAGWRRYAADRLLDRIFNEPNDLVVPTSGTWAANGSNHFPVTAREEFHEEDGVDHTGYFATSRVGDRLLEWLRA